MYRFKRIFSSLRSGRTYAAGSVVPDEMLIVPASVAELLRSGDIERALTVEPIEEPIEEIPAEKPKQKKKAKQ